MGPTLPPLAGRDREHDRLAAAIEAVAADTGGAIELEGEAGIGKTALLDALVPLAAAAGVTVLRATASALDRIRPFGPLLDALTSVPPPTAEVRAALADVEAQRGAAGNPRLSPLQAAPDQRASLADAVVGAVEAWAEAGPVALVVDDLHVAEAATVAALARLVPSTAMVPLLVVVARRPAPAGPEVLDLVGRVDADARLVLGPLAGDDLVALVRGLVGAEPGDDLVAVADRAGGNPFLASAVVEALSSSGDLVRSGGRVGVSDTAPELPAEARDSVLARFATLDDDTTLVVRTAAGLGSHFTVDELATVLDRPVAVLVDPLTRAAEHGILGQDGSTMRFRHDLLHEAIESTVPVAARAPLQLDIARRLSAAGASPERVLPHFLLGARPGDRDAVAVLREVAGQITGQAPQVAAQLLERALELLPSTAAERDEVEVDLVDALMWGGALEAAEARASVALARPLPDALAARLHETAARALMTLGRPAEAVDHALASGAVADRRAWATALASIFRLFALDLDGARADADEALALDDGTDPWAASLGHLVLGWVDNVQGYFGRAAERCDRAVAIADASPGREVHRLVPHLFRAMTLVNGGRTADAEAAVRAGRDLADDLGTSWAAPFYHYAEALAHWTDGDLDDLLVECEAGLGAAADHDAWLAAPWAYAVAAAAHLFQGRLDEAGALLAKGDALVGAGGPQYGIEWLLWIRSLHADAGGDPALGAMLLQAGWDVAQGLQAGAALTLFGPDLVRLRLALGESEAAAAVLVAMDEGEGEGERFAVDVIAQRCRGLVLGDPALIEAARAHHREQGRALEACLDDEALVAVLVRTGDERAADAVRTAIADAESLGYALVADRVRGHATAAGLIPRPRVERAVSGWDALTPGEWRIARLVGEGRSNPEIAAGLVLSRRTVESHLSRIFTKLAIANRTELALQLRDRELG